ncbi:glycoside hydrolase family 26 protein [Streptomyces sp. NPDC059442]|uniref:glycoside hydrolase family 26 protein n=1 Tax=unclassified Streptomyces TaxID=2593676 RepID=UPI00368536BB
MRATRASAAPLASLVALVSLVVLVAGFALTGCSQGSGGRPAAGAPAAGGVPYDVRPLLRPEKKYLGVSRPGAPHSMKPARDWARLVGKDPNLIAYYAAWGDGFDASGTRNAWNAGALTVVSWEPQNTALSRIADGSSDDYLRGFAQAVRTLNLPIGISFADEMNGDWEKWGTRGTTPKEYVRAWRHVHDVFQDVGATNVIWVWSPNIIEPETQEDLSRYYPGDGYVDWVGLVGYFTRWDPHTFDGLFGSTLAEVQRFSHKPRLLLETGAMPGLHRKNDVRALFDGVTAAPDIIGFAWFDRRARADWRLAVSADGVAEFRRLAANDLYGFDVRRVR